MVGNRGDGVGELKKVRREKGPNDEDGYYLTFLFHFFLKNFGGKAKDVLK